jgi:cell division inhibitor SepF
MASMWQKTMFYLGLVDDDPSDGEGDTQAAAAAPTPQPQVRSLDAPQPAPNQVDSGARAATVVAGRRVEPPSRQRRRISSNPEHAEAGVLITEGARGGAAVPMYDGGGETEIIVARTFSDAQTLADHIRAQRPVVLDLRNAETAMVRRLVDFSSGLTYGLEGKMVKIGQGVIMVMPAGVTIGVEERARLAELGLYSAPLAD